MRAYSFFSSPTWDFELVRILGATASGGCDAAEFLQAVGELRRHDGESWYRVWLHQAETALANAAEAEDHGMAPLARGYLLRAANYFRAAPYMLAGSARSAYPHDPRTVQCLQLSAEAFDRAASYMNARVLTMEVPYTNHATGSDGDKVGYKVSLPARMFLPPNGQRLRQNQKTPVVVCVGGADSTMQEQYFWLGPQSVELGYAVLVFDGPGQGVMLATSQGTGFYTLRTDYECVVSSVLDRLWSLARERPDLDLDLDRVAVAGISLGGYFSLRTAAKDPRIAAVIASDPIADMWDMALTRLPGWFAHGWLAGWVPDAVLNAMCHVNMSLDVPTRWEFRQALAIMGQKTPADLLREFHRYTLRERQEVRGAESRGGVSNQSSKNTQPSHIQRLRKDDGKESLLRHIKCPVLLTGAKLALYLNPDASTYSIADALINVPDGQLEIWVPGSVGEGAMTAKVGAWYRLAGKVLIFLDKQLQIKRPVE